MSAANNHSECLKSGQSTTLYISSLVLMERKQLTTCPFLTPVELCESQIPYNGNERFFFVYVLI